MISPAYAQAAGGADGGIMGLLPIVLMFVLLYFLMIRPQMKRQKEHRAMVEALKVGDEIITASGILGKVTMVSDSYIKLEVAGVEMPMQKAAVSQVLPKGTIKAI